MSKTNDLNKSTNKAEEKNTTNDIITLVIKKEGEPIVKDDLKAMYQSVLKGDVKEVVIDSTNLSKDALTNVYVDKLSSLEYLVKLERLSFNNIKPAENTIPPYVMSSIFTRVSFLSPDRLVNLKILELKNCQIQTKTYYNLIKITAFNNLEVFTSVKVNIDKVDEYYDEIMGLFKESLDSRSKKITFNVTESDFPINHSKEKDIELFKSIKSHPNIDYHNLEEATLSGEANITNHN